MKKEVKGFRLIFGYLGIFLMFEGLVTVLPLAVLPFYPSEWVCFLDFLLPVSSASSSAPCFSLPSSLAGPGAISAATMMPCSSFCFGFAGYFGFDALFPDPILFLEHGRGRSQSQYEL
jgi:hypothetical protein